MKKIVISILILLILLLIFVIFKRERFQNVDGNYKISELIDFEEIRSIFRVESEEIQPQTYQTSTQPIITTQSSDSSLLAELMEFMRVITQEDYTNYNTNIKESFQNTKLNRLSLSRKFLNSALNDGIIRDGYKKLVYNYLINNDEIVEALSTRKDIQDTMISLKIILCNTIVSLNFNKTLKKIAFDLYTFNMNNGKDVSEVIYNNDNTGRFNISKNPIDGESNNSSFEKKLEYLVEIYNNKLISRVLNEYLNTESQKRKFYKDIRNSVNHVLCNLRGKDNIINPENSSDIFCGGFGNNLNIKIDFDSNYVFRVVNSAPVCRFACPNVEQQPQTQMVAPTTPASNQLVVNEYDITFTKVRSQSQGQLKNSYSLSIPSNEGISLSEGDLNVIEISTPGIFTLKFINFSDKKIELDKGFRINIKSDNVTIDGGNNMIYINNNLITNGLITNNDNFPNLKTTQGIQSAINDGIKGVSNCVIKNFDVHFNVSSGENVSVLNNEVGAGLLCSNYFGALGENNIVKNCVVHGRYFANNGGSIVGSYAGFGGSLVISGCIYIGNLDVVFEDNDNDTDYYSKSCGGIAGSNLGSFGRVLVHDCITTGHINFNYSGGICGQYVGSDGGNVVISNCTMLGDIYGFAGKEYGCGGICGADCATDMQYYENNNLKTRVFIINCNVLGKMGMYGSNNGGFVGSNVALGGDLYIIGCRTHFDTAMMNASHGYFIGSNATDSEAENKIYVISCSNKSFTSFFLFKNRSNQLSRVLS